MALILETRLLQTFVIHFYYKIIFSLAVSGLVFKRNILCLILNTYLQVLHALLSVEKKTFEKVF